MKRARPIRRESDWGAWTPDSKDAELERLSEELAESRARELKTRRELEESKERFSRLLGASRRFTHAMRAKSIQQQTSRQRLAAQYAVESVLEEAEDLTASIAGILKVLGENLDWQMAVFWTVDEEEEALLCREVWQCQGDRRYAFEEACRGSKVSWRESIPGRAWSKNRLVWTRDISRERESRWAVAIEEGLRGALAFPINSGSRAVGIVELLDKEVLRPDKELLYTVDLIGRKLGEFVERKRGESERERLVREMAAERALLSAVLRQMPAGVFIADSSGDFLLSNEEAVNIYGRVVTSVAECGRNASSYPDGEEIPWDEYPLVRSLERGEVVTGVEHYVHRPDDTKVLVGVNSAPVRDEEGRVVAAVKSFLDITELRQAQWERERLRFFEATSRAEAAERERISRELHDRVSHSMGVVHQSLQLYEVLAKKNPERAEKKLQVAKEMTRVSLEQTRNLSTELRRSETEKGLVPALRDLLEVAVPDEISTELSISGEESLLAGQQRSQIYLVLREAVRNAVGHSGCARIKVALDTSPEEFSGCVEDDGRGLNGNGEASGGLGLQSMRERALLLEGEIELYSPVEGGTGVRLSMPLRNGRE